MVNTVMLTMHLLAYLLIVFISAAQYFIVAKDSF